MANPSLPDEFAGALDAAGSRLGPFQHRVTWFPTIGSTNDLAMTSAASGAPEGTTIVADEQTAGRGRRGRTWFSPPGSGLYVSVVLRPAAPDVLTPAVTLLTLAAGVALAEGIRAATGLPVNIKWPNDLVIGRRKLAGILAEAVSATGGVQAIVLGFGINIRPAAYPPDLAPRATSLESELGRGVDRGLVLAEALAGLAARYDELRARRFDNILGAWRTLAPGSRGSLVEWATPSGPRHGRTEGIDDTGALLVRTSDAVERIVAGEIVWK
ncbi:MAG TPA: biotin--[acetyl-CoA-carboxylase] ligase [Vicinamibacterales bacterium]|jgi:BirA family biotin operon repressor/biotin-[acetyl-CoA-carboxylase] ligase